jgi:hypothetical protein
VVEAAEGAVEEVINQEKKAIEEEAIEEEVAVGVTEEMVKAKKATENVEEAIEVAIEAEEVVEITKTQRVLKAKK